MAHKHLKILSLFDGMSVAQQALKNIGADVEVYYASEIDEYAIAVTQSNFPNTVQMGDICGIKGDGNELFANWGESPHGDVPMFRDARYRQCDILIGGSPCQDLSISKSKTRQGLNGNKSSLFYEYLRILKEVKPKYFILENVASMSDESKDIISKELGVEPVELNAEDFSAQSRARYFWTNIPVKKPEHKNEVMLGDILESNVNEKYYYNDVPFEIYDDVSKRVIGKIEVAGHDILKRIYNRLMKAPTITTCGGGNTQHKVFDNNRVRKLTPNEYLSLQSLPDNYFDKAEYKGKKISDSQKYKMCGNAFNCAVIEHIIKQIL
jgi:DNA (cytosine-5)-methyltransferase 3A